MNLKIILVGVGTLACSIGFGGGLLVGRRFPARQFEKFGNSTYLLDTTTGKVCDPFKDPNESTNPLDQAFHPQAEAKSQPDPFIAYGGHAVDSNGFAVVRPSYPPACSK